MDWQPIETAPKDGTRVLITDGVNEPTVGYYVEQAGRWFDDCPVQLWHLVPPTFWLAIPPLPAKAK